MINYSVRSLDLRNVKEQAADARRRLANERHIAVKTMGAPVLRPLSATTNGNTVYIRPTTSAAAKGTHSSPTSSGLNNSTATTLNFGSSALNASALQTNSSSSSSSSSSTTTEQIVTSTTNQGIMEVAALHAKCNYLETALENLCKSFTSSLSTNTDPNSEYYTVSFGPGPIGMILTTSNEGMIEVAELRDDKEGKPLLAKASGKIKLSDNVLAINNHILNRHGTATLENVALEFKAATRPVTVLFQRKQT